MIGYYCSGCNVFERKVPHYVCPNCGGFFHQRTAERAAPCGEASNGQLICGKCATLAFKKAVEEPIFKLVEVETQPEDVVKIVGLDGDFVNIVNIGAPVTGTLTGKWDTQEEAEPCSDPSGRTSPLVSTSSASSETETAPPSGASGSPSPRSRKRATPPFGAGTRTPRSS